MSCSYQHCSSLPAPPSKFCSTHFILDNESQPHCPAPGCSNFKRVEQGKVHGFCCRAHASLAPAAIPLSVASASPVTICRVSGCGKPCYPGSPACSRSHLSLLSSSPVAQKTPSPAQTGAPTCSTPGCSRTCAARSNGGYHPFCSNSCASANPITSLSTSTSVSQGPLTELSSSDPDYNSVITNQFLAKWNGTKPTVHKFFKITPSSAVLQAFEDKRKAVISEMGSFPVHHSAKPGNVCRRFHGTRCMCGVGNTSTTLCSNSTCAVCGIIKESWKVSKASSGTFGKGIYFSSNPVKSNGYNSPPSGAATQHRYMFVAKVIVGKGCKTTSGGMTFQPGYHSVLGNLSMDEVVIYSDSQAVPCYLIIYS